MAWLQFPLAGLLGGICVWLIPESRWYWSYWLPGLLVGFVFSAFGFHLR